jgi:hypothetical protein
MIIVLQKKEVSAVDNKDNCEYNNVKQKYIYCCLPLYNRDGSFLSVTWLAFGLASSSWMAINNSLKRTPAVQSAFNKDRQMAPLLNTFGWKIGGTNFAEVINTKTIKLNQLNKYLIYIYTHHHHNSCQLLS